MTSEIEKLKDGCYRFTCRDCGNDVYSFGPKPDAPKCAVCMWLSEFGQEIPEERKQQMRRAS